MPARQTAGRPATARDRLFLGTPQLWPLWPYLPLVRRWPRGIEELGVLIDFRGTSGRTGYRATVFLTNLFELPDSEEALLRLNREVYDTADEVAAAGWRVD
jgi:hypothetical protein